MTRARHRAPRVPNAHVTDAAYDAIAAPIYLSTTFERAADGSYPRGYEYSRDDNPNRRQLEIALADLEGGEDAAAFASGSAAAMTLFQALRPGDRVVVSDDCYFGVRQMLDSIYAPWGLDVVYVDTSDPALLANALKSGVRLVFIETPSNPQLKITDLRLAARLAQKAGAILACDNTIATPILQRPLELGADIVVHSTTKYISGHHDAMGGALVTARKDDLWDRIRFAQKHCGCIPSPFASWLTSRGLPTLRHRVLAQGYTAVRLAEHLCDHSSIERVLHPQLIRHPGYDVASAQMTGAVSLFSILVSGHAERATQVAAAVRVFKRATSFGGTESLIEHRSSIEGPTTATPPNLLRLAIGLEAAEDLMRDLDRALSTAE